MTTVQQITNLIEECRQMAIDAGCDGEAWEPTAGDMEYVIDRLGHKPTREQWRDATGLGWIGDAHYDE